MLFRSGLNMNKQGLDKNYVYISLEPYLNRLILPVASGDAYCFRIDGYLVFFKKTPVLDELAVFLKQTVGPDISEEISSRVFLKAWRKSQDVAPGDAKISFYDSDNSDDHFYVKGWTFSTTSKSPSSDSIHIVLESTKSGQQWISPLVYHFGTSDVAEFFNNPELANVGFSISLSNKNLKNGSYRMGLLFRGQDNTKSLFWVDHYINVNRPMQPVLSNIPTLTAGDVRYDVHKVDITKDQVSIESWAFPQKGICPTCKAYFVLHSPSSTYEIEANIGPRSDVSGFFKDSTLVNCGLTVKFDRSNVEKDLYQLGILFRDTTRSIQYFSETAQTIKLDPNEFSDPVVLQSIPLGNDSIVTNIDRFIENSDFYEIEGWAFIHNLTTKNSRTFVVLQSEKLSYILDPSVVRRPDVEDYFKTSYDLSRSGYKVMMKKKDIAPGQYKVCIIIENTITKKQTISCSDMMVEI